MALLVAFGSELTWFVEVSSLHSSVEVAYTGGGGTPTRFFKSFLLINL